jgi:hypothetical protein
MEVGKLADPFGKGDTRALLLERSDISEIEGQVFYRLVVKDVHL